MSFRAAQRALVRMYFDPAFVEAARRDPDRVLAELPAALRNQLASVDPRAFRLDRLRRRRTLSVLREEFPESTRDAPAGDLERFFESSEFHRAIFEDASLPLAFAAYLAERAPSQALAVETAIAQARRSSGGDPPPDHLALAGGVVPIPSAAAPHRLAIRLGRDVNLVEVAPPLYRIVLCLAEPQTEPRLIAEAQMRGVDRRDAEAAIAELLEGEIVVRG